MITLKNFTDTFQEVSEAHNMVNTYTTGEQSDIALTGKDKYPLVHLDQPFQITIENGIEINSIRFYVLDYQNKESMYIDSISSCKQIGQEIITYLRINYTSSFQLNDTYNITTFTEFSDDNCVGCLFEVDVRTPLAVNRCDVKNGLFDL